MRIRITRFFAAAAAAGLMLGGLGLAAAAPASAGLSPHIVQDTNGVAGYAVIDTGWRIRDAHSTMPVTAAMRDLNGNRAGAAGNQLCDPNTGTAAQIGLIWNTTARAFQVHYAFGFLGGTSRTLTTDPCIIHGLVVKDPSQAPRLLQDINIHAGDLLTFDVFYNQVTENIQFTASDLTQNTTREVSFFAGWQSFYEAGIGVLSGDLPNLTPPAVNLIAPFTSASFNSYSATGPSRSVLGGWETAQVETVNSGAQVILSPDSGLNAAGSSFKVFEGGIV